MEAEDGGWVDRGRGQGRRERERGGERGTGEWFGDSGGKWPRGRAGARLVCMYSANGKVRDYICDGAKTDAKAMDKSEAGTGSC